MNENDPPPLPYPEKKKSHKQTPEHARLGPGVSGFLKLRRGKKNPSPSNYSSKHKERPQQDAESPNLVQFSIFASVHRVLKICYWHLSNPQLVLRGSRASSGRLEHSSNPQLAPRGPQASPVKRDELFPLELSYAQIKSHTFSRQAYP